MTKRNNSRLTDAKRGKNDEFYTQLTDIEKELRYYRKHFKGKTILCNCDDPFESNFFKYFVLNFNKLELKKLIATCYATSPISNQQLSLFNVLGGDESNKEKPYKAVVTKVYDATGDGGIDMFDVAELFKMGENKLTELKGDGDFRSDECLELLEEADIVVTNPPFSLFREYVATLVEYDKKFIIIGNINAVTYKEFFPLIKDNKVWLGSNMNSGCQKFFVPDYYPLKAASCGIDKDGRKFIKVNGIRWYTNLDIKKRHEDLILIKRYNEDDYPKYDNYDAIEVSKVKNIPYDYEGVMGVPITFLDKYNPDQFEILGITDRQNTSGMRIKKYTKKDSDRYNDLNARSVLKLENGDYKQVYARILIKNKHPEIR